MLKNFSYDRQWILPRGSRSINFYLAATASLVALSIVLTRYFSVLLFGNAMRLSIGTLPIVVAGFTLGPVFGGITGLLADILGQVIRSMGAPHYGILLNNVLYGVIPGLMVFVWHKLDRKIISITVIIQIVLLSAVLQTRWSIDFAHIPYTLMFIKRLPGIMFNGVALLVCSNLLLPAMQKIQAIVAGQLKRTE